MAQMLKPQKGTGSNPFYRGFDKKNAPSLANIFHGVNTALLELSRVEHLEAPSQGPEATRLRGLMKVVTEKKMFEFSIISTPGWLLVSGRHPR